MLRALVLILCVTHKEGTVQNNFLSRCLSACLRDSVVQLFASERMRSMRSQRELQLHQQLMGIDVFRVASKPILAANQHKLAGQVSQHGRTAPVVEAGVCRTIGVFGAFAAESTPG